MYFIIDCTDKDHSGALRKETRERHLAYLITLEAQIFTAGPKCNDKGDVIGSLFIMEFASVDEASIFVKNDPYHKAGLFSEVRIIPYRMTFPVKKL